MFEKGHKINMGTHKSEEVKKKMSEVHKGRKKSPEHVAKMRTTKLKQRQQKVDEYLKDPKYCACGCGQIVMPDPDRGGFYLRKFIKGHFNRSKHNPMRGKTQSEETKKKISEANSGNEIWNKGLTIFDHDSIMATSKRMSKNNPSSDPDINLKMCRTKAKNGTLNSNRNKCKWYIYDGKKVQGSFELKFAKFLDGIGLQWVSHKNVDYFEYIGLDNKTHIYQPDFKDENGVYYDPHALYYWNEAFEYKIKQVRKNYPDKTFIVFHENNYIEICKQIIESII